MYVVFIIANIEITAHIANIIQFNELYKRNALKNCVWSFRISLRSDSGEELTVASDSNRTIFINYKHFYDLRKPYNHKMLWS